MAIFFRNGIKIEEIKVTVDGYSYRATGSPTVKEDNYSMVEIYRPETMHGVGDRVRFAHWARIASLKRRAKIRQAALEHRAMVEEKIKANL